MAINTYKLTYEINPLTDDFELDDDYLSNILNHIRDFGGVPDFNLPSYYRCTATYKSSILPENTDITYSTLIKYYMINKTSGVRVLRDYNKVIQASSFKRYVSYNSSNAIDLYNDIYTDLENSQYYNIDANAEPFDAGLWFWGHERFATNDFLNFKFNVDVVLTYSDDDPLAADEYVEPEKRNKIYLVNLNFGYRRSRRNKKNRLKYRNRY